MNTKYKIGDEVFFFDCYDNYPPFEIYWGTIESAEITDSLLNEYEVSYKICCKTLSGNTFKNSVLEKEILGTYDEAIDRIKSILYGKVE